MDVEGKGTTHDVPFPDSSFSSEGNMRSKGFKQVSLIFAFLFFLISNGAVSIDITSIGNWFLTIDENDLINGAGSDLNSTYESTTYQVSLTISSTSGSWRVDVRKVNTNWHSDLHLWVRRTGDGSGGSVSNGSVYQELTGTDQPFFTGSDDVSGITAQLKLSGMSVQVPPDTYTATIYYIVVDI